MKSPVIKFTGLEIPADAFERVRRKPAHQDWHRIEFQLDEDITVQSIRSWLLDTYDMGWQMYEYNHPDTHHTIVIIRFQDRNHALMFKLQNGMRAGKI
jgi:hypothetical protein